MKISEFLLETEYKYWSTSVVYIWQYDLIVWFEDIEQIDQIDNRKSHIFRPDFIHKINPCGDYSSVDELKFATSMIIARFC